MHDPLARYRSVQVQTAGREQLLLLVFDGAIERLQAAARALGAGDCAGARPPAWRAQALVVELLQTLDTERGGPLAADLTRLYGWWIQQIAHAVLHKDPAPLAAVAEQMRGQREAWAAAAARLRSG